MWQAKPARRASAGAVAIAVIAVAIAITGMVTYSLRPHSSGSAPKAATPPPASAIAATVDNAPITVEELQLFIDRDRASVAAAFESTYKIAAMDSTSWTTSYNGTIPLQTLKDEALTDAIRSKVEQVLMVDAGVTPQIVMDGFDEQLTQENLTRKAAIAAGKPVYGPSQFTKPQYYDYLLTNLRQSLETALAKANGPLAYTPAQLREYFQKEKASKYTTPDAPTVEFVEVPGPDATAASAKALSDAATSLRNGSTDLTRVAAAIKGSVHQTITINQQTQADIFGQDSGFAEAAQQMKAGEVLGPIDGDEGQYLAVCTSVTPGQTIDFATHRATIAQDYLNELYGQYLDAKVTAAMVHRFPDVIAAISAS